MLQRFISHSGKGRVMPPLVAAVRSTASSSAAGTSTTPAPTTAATTATPGKVRVRFLTPDKRVVEVLGRTGASLMEVARDVAKLDIEAACDGTCACSTCHVYIDKASFEKLPAASEDELDMLDLAPTPRETSRLSCQVTLTESLDGIEVILPDEQQNQLM